LRRILANDYFASGGVETVRFTRTAKWITIGAIAIVVVTGTWYLASPLFVVLRGTELPPSGSSVVATGSFVDGEPGHHASGRAEVLADGSRYVVRVSDFSVTNGPDIRVFLARVPRVEAGDVDLGSVRVTEGAANYAVPAGVDPQTFAYVVIWCVPFSVQFGYAALTFG